MSNWGCRKFVYVKAVGTCVKERAFCYDVVFHSVLALICGFEVRNEKLWEIIDNSVSVVN